ncbi:MAG: class I SAM-dependent methyltransferase [Candidatus Helarchaeota archaeon]|nr:class I SAM-dependent methyltransferase [Candidatus Helarchaeota archaeon]
MVLEEQSKKRWDEIFRDEKKSKIFLSGIQDGMPKFAEICKKNKFKRILDLACGSGRHILYLVKSGFEVNGLDFSNEGIKKAKSQLEEKKLHAELVISSMYKKFPYNDKLFDAVICIRAIHHNLISKIRIAIKEIERVLKPNGLIFITVPKKRSKKEVPKERQFGIKYIASRTYIILGGEEKDVPHYSFNKKLLYKEFGNFEIQKFWIDDLVHYCFIGKLRK